jgi:Homeodomain-like domain
VIAKRIVVKKYVVTLSDEERERLNALIHMGKHPARQLTKARILLKADASETGEGWSDSQIAAALDTSVDTVARTRQQLVNEGFEAVLVRKHSPALARVRIFDGAAEAKLIALACSDPPKGRKRWTLQLLEEAVVELNIVDRASDNQTVPAKAMGHPTGCQCGVRSKHGRWTGGLSSTARSGVSRGLLGRGFKATDYRNARADPGEARTTCSA